MGGSRRLSTSSRIRLPVSCKAGSSGNFFGAVQVTARDYQFTLRIRLKADWHHRSKGSTRHDVLGFLVSGGAVLIDQFQLHAYPKYPCDSQG